MWKLLLYCCFSFLYFCAIFTGMQVSCYFQSRTGSSCSFERRDAKKNAEIIPLRACCKDISVHKSLWSFSEVDTEIELILTRCGIFDASEKEKLYETGTICPHHRSELGLGWRRNSNNCAVPQEISRHQKRKADRGVSKSISEQIFRKTGILVPAGSGICRHCRASFDTCKETVQGDCCTKVENWKDCATPSIQTLSHGIASLNLEETDEEVVLSTPALSSLPPETPISLYKPSDTSEESGKETVSPRNSSRSKLNEFLSSRDVSPVRNQLKTSWQSVKGRTRRYYTRKARQAVQAVLEEIAPGNVDSLWEALVSSRKVAQEIPLDQEDSVDSALLDALSECYRNAQHWGTRRQILSIMADKVSFKTLQRWIPNLTRYRFNIARHHQLLHGRGAAVPDTTHTRMYVSTGQLSHFIDFITSAHIIQDLPFGERKLKLSSGEEIVVPNVIRTVIPSQIIQQYELFCSEEGFRPMRRSTLYRILDVCSASVRKSLQGLDYFGAQGAKAFEDLEQLVECLGDNYELGLSWAKAKKEQLMEAKRYLKGDYKVHVSKTSTVPDHCRVYALSDPSDKHYKRTCDHAHNGSCDRCSLLESVIREIEENLKVMNCTEDERERMSFLFLEAKQDIHAWKSHLLRSVNQDECRLDILKDLDYSSVLLVSDWAMKYIPRKFRESQSDWFAKRGISWHLAVAIRKRDGVMEMITFAHVFEKSISQDSCTVLSILNDVFSQLKAAMPELKKVYLRQDNAACYHSAQTLITAPQVAKYNGIEISRIDFSDPQGGKGSCDRKAATIKSHMARYLNAGHDLETAFQMKEAIDSSGGVQGVSTTVCSEPLNQLKKAIKWDKISYINNIQFSKTGLKVWRAYNIGPGKELPWENFDIPDEEELPTVKCSLCGNSNFVPIKSKKPNRQQSQSEDSDTSSSESSESSGPNQEPRLFTCSDEGCIKSFVRYSSLQKHMECGKHKRCLEQETLYDKAIKEYATKLESGTSQVPTINQQEVTSSPTPISSVLTMGWALKSKRKRKRFSDKQKEYLNSKFLIGETTGKKVDPSDVSREMRTAKDTNGMKLFNSDEFLSTQQVRSYFSRMAAKRSTVADSEESESDDDDDDDDLENELQHELKNQVLAEISVQHSHPIMHDSVNICGMVKTSKINSLSIAKLQGICEAFGLDTSEIAVRRKKPYVDLLTDLVKGCDCYQ